MKRIAIFAALFMMLANCFNVNAQNDSLRLGRDCKVVLYNGFQAEGKIVNRASDTITLKTDITNLFIPVRDIKFVLDPDVEVSDIGEMDTLTYGIDEINAVEIDTSGRCDIYLQDKSVMSDVLLVIDTDSTIKVIKENRTKVLNIAGLRKIVFKTTAPFGKGFWIGSIIGGAIGIVYLYLVSMGEAELYHYIAFGTLSALPVAVVGGLFGELFARDDIYLFHKGIYPGKIKIIKAAIEKHT